MKWFSTFLFLFPYSLFGITISIKQFGAKGDGVTNDQQAFVNAAKYINRIKKNVTLVIPNGTYIIGKQNSGGPQGAYLLGEDVLSLSDCSNISISGKTGSKLKYANQLKFGSFNPQTGKPYDPVMPFYNGVYVAQLGSTIKLVRCQNIKIKGLVLDGNLSNLQIGGQWGDKGYQIAHYGLFIQDCCEVGVEQSSFRNFALDGISVQSSLPSDMKIKLLNCQSEYNARQGLSWIGGQGLTAINCSFSHTGRGKINSSPGAGVDLECENSNEIRNGLFDHCSFINNSGCGLLAESGPTKFIQFEQCTFWGVSSWSVWVTKPMFNFHRCIFHGSFVHGCNTKVPSEATRFSLCTFEDKPYQGTGPYGVYLFESDGRKLMYFDRCTFTSHNNKVIWYGGTAESDVEKAQFNNCTMNVMNNTLPPGSFYMLMHKTKVDGLSLNLYFDLNKKYYVEDAGTTFTNLNRKEFSK